MIDRWSVPEGRCWGKYHLYGSPEGFALCDRYLKLLGDTGISEEQAEGDKCKKCLKIRGNTKCNLDIKIKSNFTEVVQACDHITSQLKRFDTL